MTNKNEIAIELCKANPISDKGIPTLCIKIGNEIGEHKFPDEYEKVFKDDAKKIVEALFETLPGGTIDQILIELLQGKVSFLTVPIKPPNNE